MWWMHESAAALDIPKLDSMLMGVLSEMRLIKQLGPQPTGHEHVHVNRQLNDGHAQPHSHSRSLAAVAQHRHLLAPNL